MRILKGLDGLFGFLTDPVIDRLSEKPGLVHRGNELQVCLLEGRSDLRHHQHDALDGLGAAIAPVGPAVEGRVELGDDLLVGRSRTRDAHGIRDVLGIGHARDCRGRTTKALRNDETPGVDGPETGVLACRGDYNRFSRRYKDRESRVTRIRPGRPQAVDSTTDHESGLTPLSDISGIRSGRLRGPNTRFDPRCCKRDRPDVCNKSALSLQGGVSA